MNHFPQFILQKSQLGKVLFEMIIQQANQDSRIGDPVRMFLFSSLLSGRFSLPEMVGLWNQAFKL